MKHYIFFFCITLFFSLYTLDSHAEASDDILLLESQAMTMINESKYGESLFYLDRILEIDPKNINALNNKGGILIELGNYTDSIDTFNEILSINENNTKALNNKAIALSKLGLYLPSLELFYKSLSIDPYDENTVNNTHNLVNNLPWIDETSNSAGIVKVRDHNGNLVGYSKISTIKIQPPLGYLMLKTTGTLEEVEIDGIMHQVLKYNGTELQTINQYVGRTDLFLTIGPFNIKVVELLLNGLITSNNDKLFYEVIIFDPRY